MKLAHQFHAIASFISVYTYEANELEKWTNGPPKTYNPYRVYQPKEYTERIPLVEKYKEEFHYSLPIVIDVIDKAHSVGVYLSGGDLLWLGAVERSSLKDNEWNVVWKSGEIPYEYDMSRLQTFLLSRWMPNKKSFPKIEEEEDDDNDEEGNHTY